MTATSGFIGRLGSLPKLRRVSRAIRIRSEDDTLQADLYGEHHRASRRKLTVEVALERLACAPDRDRAAHVAQFRKRTNLSMTPPLRRFS